MGIANDLMEAVHVEQRDELVQALLTAQSFIEDDSRSPQRRQAILESFRLVLAKKPEDSIDFYKKQCDMLIATISFAKEDLHRTAVLGKGNDRFATIVKVEQDLRMALAKLGDKT